VSDPSPPDERAAARAESPPTTPRAPRQPQRARRRPPRERAKPEPQPAEIPERAPDPERLIIGRVAAAHGPGGDFRMAILSSHPEHLASLRAVYLGDDPEPRRLRSAQLRGQDVKEAILRVDGLQTAEEAAAHRGQLVRIDRAAALPLPEGEYYHYQLLGLDVVDLDGNHLGRLAQIIETGANDVYVVRGPGGELLLPAIGEVIREVDVAGGRMVVKPQEYY